MAHSFAASCVCFLSVLPQEMPKQVGAARPAVSAAATRTVREALEPYNTLVGTWRGIGQPKRGSRAGAWIETANWVWDFKDRSQPAVVLTSEKGKLLKQLRLRFDDKKQQFLLEASFVNEGPKTFRQLPRDKKTSGEKAPRKKENSTSDRAKSTRTLKLQFREAVPEGQEAHRITLSILSDKRVTVLVEKGKSAFRRVAEIGYTRKGKSLANTGSSGPECVVTGGKGTIRVSHKGKRYYVCCSGCRQAFEDDPEGVLADYRARLEEEKKKRTSK